MDDDFLKDQEENRRELAFIRTQLPGDLKDRFTDGQLLLMMDAIAEYFFSSGVLETDDEEVDIDLETIARHVCQTAADMGEGPFNAEDVFFVVQADLDFQEQNC